MDKRQKLIFSLILGLGLFLRTLNLNWDDNQHLHPDERFLTMVGMVLEIPENFNEYINPGLSGLNPYNKGYDFFVYGTLPLTLVRFLAEKFNFLDYNLLTIKGRLVSAVLETGTLLLVFLIAGEVLKRRKEKNKAALWAMFFYAVAVLPIQLAHFFAAETFLVFFSTLAFYFLFRFVNRKEERLFEPIILGIFTGLALACKITALVLVAVVILGLGGKLVKKKDWQEIIFYILVFLFLTYVFLRLGDPRIFSSNNFLIPVFNQQFVDNLRELASFNNPESLFPPGIQWIKTKPLIFPLRNLILWGWGLPLGILVIGSIFWQGFWWMRKNWKKITKKQFGKIEPESVNLFLILVFVLTTFFYQGIQFAKAMRYFYPIYPFLAVLGGLVFEKIFSKSRRLGIGFCILALIYPLSFLSIYTHPHSRVKASDWIYENIEAGSFLANEHWDDPLPLGRGRSSGRVYEGELLSLYSPETAQKWQEINLILTKADYIILSSSRLWGSIPKVPEVYPQTSEYYRKLFNGELGFEKVAEFTSYPCFPPIGQAWFCFPDQSADESFTVYDHPKVMIFKKANSF